jgi:hypothetical protein
LVPAIVIVQVRGHAFDAVGGDVGEGVGNDFARVQALHLGRIVIQCVAVAAVLRDGQAAVDAGIGARAGHLQHGAMVDVAVVGQHVAGDGVGAAFDGGAGVACRHGRIVGADDGHVRDGARGLAHLVGDGVAEAVLNTLARRQALVGVADAVDDLAVFEADAGADA